MKIKMNAETKEQVVQELGKFILRPIAIIQSVFLLAFICTPFLWIWSDWYITWRVGLSAIFGILITTFIYSVVKKTIKKAVDQELDITNKTYKTKFLEKIERIQKERLK